MVYKNYKDGNNTISQEVKNFCLKAPVVSNASANHFWDVFPTRPEEVFQGPCTFDNLADPGFKSAVVNLINNSSFEFRFVPSEEMPCSASVARLHMEVECSKIFGPSVCKLDYAKVQTDETQFYAINSYYDDLFSSLVRANNDGDTISYELAKATIDRKCHPSSPSSPEVIHRPTTCFHLTYTFNHLLMGYNG